jgi:hypothetical protein
MYLITYFFYPTVCSLLHNYAKYYFNYVRNKKIEKHDVHTSYIGIEKKF